jgi:class 3 adenylate cyclase/tetratricopeptide (TPR) repeat protein
MGAVQPCPRCGAPVPEGARFCPACGLSLTEAPREERRIVTVLFGDLTGFTELSERLDPEEVKTIVDRAFDGLAELITLYGGRVDKVVGDEIMAVFGAPQTHEDDPERAVRCALTMQRNLAQYSHELERDRGVKLRMRIGVNTGEVVAGVVGGADAYTVVGDAVNIAKRIESAADPGMTLVGETTYLATREAVDYREHPPVVAKGKQSPLVVWEAAAERALPGTFGRRTEAPLVGRDEELALLESLANVVRRDRRSVVVTLLGDAGMGKSRLANEFARRLEPHGVRVLGGRSLPYGTASPSFAVEEMIRAALDIDPGAAPVVARDQVVERLGKLGLATESDRILMLLGLREREPATALAAGGRGGPGGGGTPARGRESLQAATNLFAALAAREELLVLVFHELHWGENTLLEYIAELAEGSRNVPLLMLCLARPDLVERAPAWLGRPASALLTLEPLPRDRAAELLDRLLGREEILPGMRENVLDRAGGNPFFLEELVRYLLDRGELGSTDRIAVPSSVQGLVAARLDALPTDARRFAQHAAIIGEQFWLGALQRLEHDGKADEIDKLLDVLVDKELIEPVEPPRIPDQKEYRFRQALVREVAYAGIPKQQRARHHAVVGRWIEDTTCACGLEREFFDLVGHHYERSASLGRDIGLEVEGAGAKAREYLERAGDEALGMDAAAVAAGFFERALAFATDEEDRLHLRLHLAEALVGCWRPAQAQEQLGEALSSSRRLGDRRAEGKALRLLGDLLRMRGDIDEARPHLEHALAIAKEVGDLHEEAEGLRSHGLADLLQGRLSSAALWFRQALARSREIGDKRGEAWSLVNLAWADLELGRLDEAYGFTEEGVKIFGEIGDAEGIGWCLGMRAWVLLFQGKLVASDELVRQLEEMMQAAQQQGVLDIAHFGWAIGRVCRAIAAVSRARLTEAEELARSSLPRFEDAESHWGLAMARFPLGVAAVLRRRFDDASQILTEGAREAAQAGDPLVRALMESLLAGALAEADELEAAERRAAEALQLTSPGDAQWIRGAYAGWVQARILRGRGLLAEARAVLEEAIGYPDNGLFGRSRTRALLAEVLIDLGQPAEAVAVARAAVDEAGDDVLGAAAARRALARALLGAGDAAGAEAAVRDELALLTETDWDEERIKALALLARILDQLGRHDESGVTIDQAREILGRFGPGTDVRELEQLVAG